jgi:predicted metalloprotease
VPADNAAEEKRNRTALPLDEVLPIAMKDIQDYWAKTMPEVYGQPYQRIPDDKLYAATEEQPGPACVKGGDGTEPGTYDDVKDNAFYCSEGQFVEWDAQELIPDLYKKYGQFAVALVFAHEWGHAVQDQVGGILGGHYQTILTENMADCFAGAWTAHSLAESGQGGLHASAADLQSALAGMLQFRDTVGTDVNTQGAHGSGFDRINGFQTGFEQGAKKCATFPSDPPNFTNFTFNSEQDAQQGGNLPYDDAVADASQDLNAYWAALAKKFDDTFKPVDNVQQFSKDTQMPTCGDKTYTPDEALGTVFFCVDDNYVAWDSDMMKDVHDEIGDFAVATLLAEQWAVSAESQSGLSQDVINSKAGHLQQACFTGTWARAVADGDAHNPAPGGGPTLALSPGDLDKAIGAFLAFGANPNDLGTTPTGSAFEQVEAFRDGFLTSNNESSCAQYTQGTAGGPGSGSGGSGSTPSDESSTTAPSKADASAG